MLSKKIASACQNKRARRHEGDPKYCNACKRVYCDACYDAQLVHEDETNQVNDHEKTDLDTANFVLSLFSTSPEVQESLHYDNIHSKWFGIEYTDPDERESKCYFKDFGGFVNLLNQSERPRDDQFPFLISFVGETGAGKSTLINGILKLPDKITQSFPEVVLSPAMGLSYQQNQPTSGDVHLFGDPVTRDSRNPLFYADCEGIGGGEFLPAATQYLGKLGKLHDLRELVYKQREMYRPVSRGWAVRELYPRILFPFSDIVCYVTRNPRRFEDHIGQLLCWAHNAIDKSTNQPVLPHAFLVINAFTVDEAPKGHFQDWWGTGVTSHFLEARRDSVKSASSTLGRLASVWNTQRGRNISSLEQLIKCYYCDFKIICIPETRSTQLSRITAQYRKLQHAIRDASENSRKTRQSLAFLMSAETLGRYLEMAFDHFVATPNKPFNFLSAALLRSPVARTLKDHICKLAVHYMAIFPTKAGRDLFKELAPWIASCIFLNSHRSELPKNDADAIFKRYQHFCNAAQTEFYVKKWPCEAVDKNGNRCINMGSTHSTKGHQNQNGRIFASRDKDARFQLALKSSFKTDEDKRQANEDFSTEIQEQLKNCIWKYKDKISKDKPKRRYLKTAVADIHMSMLERFKGVMNDFISHKTCFCCLASTPAHKLPCGHIICQLCLEDYSSERDNFFCLKRCPLCGSRDRRLKFEMKPATAGLRILCLDGGRVRSIIQIQILRELEHAIGLDIPIHRFFDLIVGTSGGGIVAAAIGLKRLGIDECVKLFTNFAKNAFKKRLAIDWPVIGKLVMARHHGIYKTIGLENVLKEYFGEDYMFGADIESHHRTISNLKIALTATSSGRRTFLLTNYNRPPPERMSSKKLKSVDRDENQSEQEAAENSKAEKGTDEVKYTEGSISSNSDESTIEEKGQPRKSQKIGGGSTMEINKETLEELNRKFSREYRKGDISEDSSDTHPDDSLDDSSDESSFNSSDESSSDSLDQPSGDSLDKLSDDSQDDFQDDSSDDSSETINKNFDTRFPYTIFRGETQEMELRLWEALRAATAAPGYFKSFCHSATTHTFDDGALTCNNPASIADKERKALWPDLSNRDPDILLSIGTGRAPFSQKSTNYAPNEPKPGMRGYMQKMIKIGLAAVSENMDCEIMWAEFIERLRVNDNAPDRMKRYQRLNPELKTVFPRMDDIDQIPNMQSAAHNFCSQSQAIKEIANTLIGSLFYFELNTVHPDRDSSNPDWKFNMGFHCTGTIKCRLLSETLAQRVKDYENPKRAPNESIFLIGQQNRERREVKIYRRFGGVAINSYGVHFKLKHEDKNKDMCMYLSLWDNPAKAVSISGFPRLLYEEAKSFATGESSKNYSSRLLPA